MSFADVYVVVSSLVALSFVFGFFLPTTTDHSSIDPRGF